MGHSRHDGLAIPGQVVLAHEPDFALGILTIRPATRQVETGGTHETLEPRVMQALVALARADGGIVTRDELIERCWDGRIVSDDAINRVLSRIRQMAAGIGAGSFTLETITKVGYRLVPQSGHAPPPSASSVGVAQPTPWSRRAAIAGSGAIVAATAGFGLWQWLAPRPAANREALAFYRKGIEAREQGWFEIFDQAEDWFRQAVRADPQFADAWGALALQLAMEMEDADERRLASLASDCRSAAQRALSLDPNQLAAQAALALLPNRFRHWGMVERGMRNAYLKQPDNWLLSGELGWLLSHVARFDDAIALLDGAVRASPFVPLPALLLTYAYLASNRIEEALAESGRAIERWPHHPGTWMTRLDVLNQTGKFEEARAFESDRSQGLPRELPLVRLFTGATRALETRSPGDILALRQAATDAVAKQERQAAPAALMMSAVGEVDTAFEFLDAYFFRRGRFAPSSPRGMSPLLRRDTDFLFYPLARALWRDSRFDKLTAGIGLDAYWHSAGFVPPNRRG